jgi:uncharacterized protein (TIGR02594 family)
MTIASLVPKGTLYRIGSSGPAVALIQKALASLGYALKGTGYFGTSTDVAVETFQKRAGLRIDGIVGPNTAAAIDRALSSNRQNIPAEVIRQIGRPLWLEAGIKLIGTKEVPGAPNNPVIIDWAKEEGGNISREYTHDSIPWCALFINLILTRVGLKGTETLWALDFDSDYMKRRVGHGWDAVKLPGPAVGAIAPMVRNGGGHVICIVGVDQHGNVMGLGGNQSDAVSIVPFPQSRLNRGFWWPASVPVPRVTGFSQLPVVLSNGNVSTKES